MKRASFGPDRNRDNDQFLQTLSGKAYVNQVEWLGSLGLKFIDVAYVEGSRIVLRKHVDDYTTLQETIEMSDAWRQPKVTAAVYPYMGRWALMRKGKSVKYYDTQEAAEMAGVHLGR